MRITLISTSYGFSGGLLSYYIIRVRKYTTTLITRFYLTLTFNKKVELLAFQTKNYFQLKFIFPFACLCSSLCFLDMCCLNPPLDVSSIEQYGQERAIFRW